MSEMWTRKFEHDSSDFPNLEIFPKVLLCLVSCLTAYTYIVFIPGHSDIMVSQVVPVVKNPIADTRDARDVGSVLVLGRRKWQPIPVFLFRKAHGQRAW